MGDIVSIFNGHSCSCANGTLPRFRNLLVMDWMNSTVQPVRLEVRDIDYLLSSDLILRREVTRTNVRGRSLRGVRLFSGVTRIVSFEETAMSHHVSLVIHTLRLFEFHNHVSNMDPIQTWEACVFHAS